MVAIPGAFLLVYKHTLTLKGHSRLSKEQQSDTTNNFPYGLAVRIPGFHPGGPGSTPGMGNFFP